MSTINSDSPGLSQAGFVQPVVVVNGPGRQGPAITSLVLGIIAAVICLIPIVGMVSLVLVPIGLVFGAIAWRGAAKARRAGNGKAIAGVVLAVVSFIGAVASTVAVAGAVDDANDSLNRAFGNATEKLLAEDLGVDIGRYSVKDQGFGLMDGRLSVTLTNKSDRRQSFDVKIEALSSSGTRIATDTVGLVLRAQSRTIVTPRTRDQAHVVRVARDDGDCGVVVRLATTAPRWALHFASMTARRVDNRRARPAWE